MGGLQQGSAAVPAAWSASVTYSLGALVIGSDKNLYVSLANSNLNHDPTSDGGVHWSPTPETLTGVVAIANGGTGQTTAAAALSALAGAGLGNNVQWAALTTFGAYQLVQLPTGGLAYVTASYTTRATFDQTERNAWVWIPGGHSDFFAASSTWTVPTGIQTAEVDLVAAGGSGGGAGSAAQTGGVATQVGGGGGGAGMNLIRRLTGLVAADVFTVTIGAGASGGAGGAASSGVTGNAGTAGSAGGNTTFSDGTTILTASGGGGGAAGAANSSATVNAGAYAAPVLVGQNNTPGSGGVATSTLGNRSVPLAKTVGGSGGAPASSTNGGVGGVVSTGPGISAGSVNTLTGTTAGGNGAAGTFAGSGGAGGGGGAPGGAGGNGGASSNGHLYVWY